MQILTEKEYEILRFNYAKMSIALEFIRDYYNHCESGEEAKRALKDLKELPESLF